MLDGGQGHKDVVALASTLERSARGPRCTHERMFAHRSRPPRSGRVGRLR
jgi:hypothetical protein